MRCQRGQATVENIAVIAIVALLIGAAAAVAGASGAPNIVNGVLGGVQRALCVVSGRTCPALAQQPCVDSSARRAFHVAVSLVIFRVDKDHIFIRENMSDGTVRLTLAQRSSVGVEAGFGGRLQLKLKRRTIGFRREARIGAQGVFGNGIVFVADSAAEADAIMRRLLRPRLPDIGGLPSPREIFAEGGLKGLARLGLEGVVGASLDGRAEGILGVRRDQRSGEITLSLNAGGSGWALANALFAGQSRSIDRSVELDLKLDRHHRPIGLTLRSSGTLAAGESLAPELGARQGFTPTLASGGRSQGGRWEAEARLDLDDPGVAAAWAAFRRDRDDPAAIGELAALLRDRSHLDVRSYAVKNSSVGGAAGVALALKIGAEGEISSADARLLTAESRPPGGLWERRIDCRLV